MPSRESKSRVVDIGNPYQYYLSKLKSKKAFHVTAPKLTKAKILKAIPGTGGIIAELAKRLNVHRCTIDAYAQKMPEVQEAIDVERNAFIEVAESSLMRLIQEGNVAATIFYLKTKGKHLGYVERAELQKVKPPAIEISKDEAAYFNENAINSQPESQPNSEKHG